MAPLSSRQINCRRTDADGRRRDLIRQAEAAAGRELGGRRTLPLSPSSDALPSENYNEVKVGGERRSGGGADGGAKSFDMLMKPQFRGMCGLPT